MDVSYNSTIIVNPDRPEVRLFSSYHSAMVGDLGNSELIISLDFRAIHQNESSAEARDLLYILQPVPEAGYLAEGWPSRL